MRPLRSRWNNWRYRRALVRAHGEDAGRAMDELAALHADPLSINGLGEKTASTLKREATLWDRMGEPRMAAMFIRAAREADPDWQWDPEHEPGDGRWYFDGPPDTPKDD